MILNCILCYIQKEKEKSEGSLVRKGLILQNDLIYLQLRYLHL